MAQRTSTKPAAPQLNAANLRTFHQGLLKWYKTHGRHELPWRKTSDPYAIWVSEVMLQQTQVSTVLNTYYFPFLERFPTVQALAAAPREQVLKAWEGLGYYRRAGFLHEAAKILSKGAAAPSLTLTPRSPTATQQAVDALQGLPGIGRNTAHAILTFAHHQPLPVMEANVKRIVARIFALKTPTDDELWQGAYTLMGIANPLSEPSARSERAQKLERTKKYVSFEHASDKKIGRRKDFAFDYNQAMMDLGALICTPRTPHCTVCPANTICKGKHAPELYPTKKAKKPVPTRRVAILVREDAAGRLYLEPRSDALLGGLYGFPQSAKASGKELGVVSQTYSHFKLEGAVHHQRLNTHEKGENWYTREQIAALPLSRADHKVLALLGNTSLKK